MIYSEKLVWEAVYHFIPSLKVARNHGVAFNLPSSIDSAALQAFISDYAPYTESYLYAEVLRVTIKEIEMVGWMTFGDQDDL